MRCRALWQVATWCSGSSAVWACERSSAHLPASLRPHSGGCALTLELSLLTGIYQCFNQSFVSLLVSCITPEVTKLWTDMKFCGGQNQYQNQSCTEYFISICIWPHFWGPVTHYVRWVSHRLNPPTINCTCLLIIHHRTALMSDFVSYIITFYMLLSLYYYNSYCWSQRN